MSKQHRSRASTKRWLVSDGLWLKVEPLIPKPKNPDPLGRGRPRACNRKSLNGILFVLRTGCQWKALDDTGICSGSTAHTRFQEWTEARVFETLWAQGLEEYDEMKGIQWRWQSMDGAMTKAPLGGEKNGGQPHRPGQARRQAQPVV